MTHDAMRDAGSLSRLSIKIEVRYLMASRQTVETAFSCVDVCFRLTRRLELNRLDRIEVIE